MPENALRDASVPVGVGAIWKPTRGLEIRADAVYEAWRF